MLTSIRIYTILNTKQMIELINNVEKHFRVQMLKTHLVYAGRVYRRMQMKNEKLPCLKSMA